MKLKNLNKMENKKTITEIASENKWSMIWEPTCYLRWVNYDIPVDETTCKIEKVLQQMWQGNLGEQDWRDIELVVL